MDEIKEQVSAVELDASVETNVGAAIEAFRELHGFNSSTITQDDPNGIEVISLPAGMRLIDITKDLDARRSGPRRIKCTETVHTLESFITLVSRHRTNRTAVWASFVNNQPKLTAVIDYHGASEHGESGPVPAWCEHRVGYEFPFSDAFKRWARAGQLLSQRDFVKFTQERARDIVDPQDVETPPIGTLVRDTMLDVMRAAGRLKADRESKSLAEFYGDAAHLVDVAKRMSSHVGSNVKEVDRGLGGLKITFEDEKRVEGVEGAREYYLVDLEVFRGSEKAVLPARLRAEATEGGLLIGLELVGVDKLIESAFQDGCKKVHSETKCPVYHGTIG